MGKRERGRPIQNFDGAWLDFVLAFGNVRRCVASLGVSRSSLTEWATGKRTPTWAYVRLIDEAARRKGIPSPLHPEGL